MNDKSAIENLKELAEMKNNGVLTDAEFEKLKADILSTSPTEDKQFDTVQTKNTNISTQAVDGCCVAVLCVIVFVVVFAIVIAIRWLF